MSYTPTAQDRLAVRMEVSDTDISLPILDDSVIDYYLTKNSGAILATSLECAKAILFRLSLQGDSVVDIISIKGSKVAESYREALRLYIKDPSLNGLYNKVQAYAGGVSSSDAESNRLNSDNLAVKPLDTASYPSSDYVTNPTVSNTNPFTF